MSETILQINNLHISFRTNAGEVKAVRQVNFELKKGETLAIVGESGSGKTVTMQALMGLLNSNASVEGEINFKGKKLNEMTEEEMVKVRGKGIAAIFQNPKSYLNPTMKVSSQIAETIMIYEGCSKASALGKALELMKCVGIPEAEAHIDDYPHQWSGGMCQRAVIAIALASNPDILIADEPTTALDVIVQAQFLSLVKTIQEERGTSVIFITHDLSLVAGIADRVAVMYAGKIIEYGGVDDIFYHPQHPFTWALLNALPTTNRENGDFQVLSGSHPDLLNLPKGDAFAPRNEFALDIDFEEEAPMFKISETHYAATWLLDERAPEVTPPSSIQRRWKKWQSLKEGVSRDKE